jgi:hypothetical protein
MYFFLALEIALEHGLQYRLTPHFLDLSLPNKSMGKSSLQ